jgi:DNA (cytosine-5)-methyltransferase 1
MLKKSIDFNIVHNNNHQNVFNCVEQENSENTKTYTIAETFIGAGGSHLGFKNNGFKTIYINEWNKDCIETLKYNNPEIFQDAIIDSKDINDIDFVSLSKKLKHKVDVLFGGVVCKGFSLAGEKSPVDERNYLYRKQLELVEALQPKISIIENVPALLRAKIVKTDIDEALKNEIAMLYNALEKIKGAKADMRKKNISTLEEDKKSIELRTKKKEFLNYLDENNMFITVMDDIKNIYDKMGYKVYYNILNATWYGSATARDRIVIVAVRKDIPQEYTFPTITHFDKTKNKEQVKIPITDICKKIMTVNDALSVIDYNNKDDADNIPMNHNQKTVERFSYIPEGGNIQDVINAIPKDLHISKFYSRGCTMRLDRHKPSPTLVPGHSNFPVHPQENRSITVREAATITGFPLNYKFFGSHTSRCEQVGNAVPVHLSDAIAKSVKEFLDSL